jgi:hypothetical protein
MNKKTKKRDAYDPFGAAAEEATKTAISSGIIADLKHKGIVAFRQLTDDEQKRVWQWCNEVVQYYRAVLETDPKNIRNVESLAFPKEDIKLAMKMLLPLFISKDMHSMVRKLKNAYQEIGTFQTIDPKDREYLCAIATSRAKVNSNTQYPELVRAKDKYMELVISEKKGLLQEINNYVNELETRTSESSS